MGNKLVACAMERQECLSDVGSRKGIYVNRVKKPRRRRQKNKNTSTQLNLDAVAHVSSPEKYVSQNLNNNMGGIDKDVMMEKVLAENRRLTLLMQKMSKGSDSAASAERFGLGGDENDGRVINSMDYFGDEMDGELDDSLEFGSLYSPNPKVGPRSDGGHKLFVDQILGVSSDYLSQGKSPAKSRYTKHIDPSSGRTYFYDVSRKKSIWADQLNKEMQKEMMK